jgi:hypothetical protein
VSKLKDVRTRVDSEIWNKFKYYANDSNCGAMELLARLIKSYVEMADLKHNIKAGVKR